MSPFLTIIEFFHLMLDSHEDDIYDQLINGIRSLDVRVGYYPGEEGKFYINHDAIRIRPLQTLLQDVRRFVQETNEIVFLDFHRFPVGFNSPEVHHELIAVLQTELGEMLLPKSVTLSVTPDQVWESNQNILLFYADGVASNYDTLWPGLEQVIQLPLQIFVALFIQQCVM